MMQHHCASQGLIQLYLCTVRPNIVMLFCVLLKMFWNTKALLVFVELLWFVQFCLHHPVRLYVHFTSLFNLYYYYYGIYAVFFVLEYIIIMKF
jgi:hypothetical protein